MKKEYCKDCGLCTAHLTIFGYVLMTIHYEYKDGIVCTNCHKNRVTNNRMKVINKYKKRK